MQPRFLTGVIYPTYPVGIKYYRPEMINTFRILFSQSRAEDRVIGPFGRRPETPDGSRCRWNQGRSRVGDLNR